MVLPVKLQASILSWVGEGPAESSQHSGKDDGSTSIQTHSYPLLTPADLFSLSSQGMAAGSPGVVVKDGFLGQEQAMRARMGEMCLHLLARCREMVENRQRLRSKRCLRSRMNVADT